MNNKEIETQNDKQIITLNTEIQNQAWRDRIQTNVMLAMVNLESLISDIYDIPVSPHCSFQIIHDVPE